MRRKLYPDKKRQIEDGLEVYVEEEFIGGLEAVGVPEETVDKLRMDNHKWELIVSLPGVAEPQLRVITDILKRFPIRSIGELKTLLSRGFPEMCERYGLKGDFTRTRYCGKVCFVPYSLADLVGRRVDPINWQVEQILPEVYAVVGQIGPTEKKYMRLFDSVESPPNLRQISVSMLSVDEQDAYRKATGRVV